MQSIIASERAGAVETTSSATGLVGGWSVGGRSVARWCLEGTGRWRRAGTVSPSQRRTPSVAPRGQGLMICVFPLQWHIVPAPLIKKESFPQHLATALLYRSILALSGKRKLLCSLSARAVVNQGTLWKRALIGMHCAYLFFCWLVSPTARVVLSVPTKMHSRCYLM